MSKIILKGQAADAFVRAAMLASEPPVRSSELVRPVCRKAVTLEAKLTACTLTMYDAREQIANELRRIADMVEEGDTFSESGNMGICDYGSWQLPDPWEE